MEREFRKWFFHTIVASPVAGTDYYGEETLGDPVTIEGVRVVKEVRMARGPEGDDLISTVTVYVPGDKPAVANGSSVPLEDGSVHEVVRVEEQPDERPGDPHHRVLYLA